MSENKYGYKICYREYGKQRTKIYLVTNRFDTWNIRWYESHSPPDRKTGKPIENATWLILPIKTLIEYKWRWRGCPF